MRAYVAALCFGACSVVIVNDAAACSCVELSPCARFAQASAVFVGEVMDVGAQGDRQMVRIRVVQSWKGQLGEIVTVSGGSRRSSCEFEFNPGERWLIYASESEAGLVTHVCSGGGRLRTGEPMPDLLPVPGRVYGAVAERPIERIAQSRKDESDPSVPVRSGRAILEVAGGRQEAAIVDGRFQFDGVGPGQGQIRFELDGGLDSRPETFMIAYVTDCAAVFAVARPAGRLGGWAKMADGSTASGVTLQLLPRADASKSWSFSGDDTSTADQGRFEFQGLRPGDYVLRVSSYAGPSGRHPHSVIYYPGVPDAESATVIAVGRQRELEAPFVLPPALPTRNLTARVTCSDGSTPPIVSIDAKADTDPPQHGDEASSYDGTGVATVRILRQVPYSVTIKASFPLPPPRTSFEPRVLRVIDLEAGTEPPPIEIVAPFVKCARRTQE